MSSNEDAGILEGLPALGNSALSAGKAKKARKTSRLLTVAMVVLFLAVLGMLALIAATIVAQGKTTAPLSRAERDLAIHQAAVKAKPEDFEARTKLAAAYLQADQPEKAIAEADKALALDGRALGAILVMGSAHLQLGDLDKAERDYMAILKVSAGHQIARTRLAQIYLEKGEAAKAAEQLDMAIERAPTAADLLVLRGVVYELDKDEEKAREVYTRALELIPGYSLALEGIGRLDRGEPVDPSSFFGAAAESRSQDDQ